MIPEGLPGLIKSGEWHARRRKYIGSSDWSHILAPHNPDEYKWWCIRQLYYEKNAVPHDFPERISAAAARGIFLEDKVLEMFKIDTVKDQPCKSCGKREDKIFRIQFRINQLCQPFVITL